MAGHVFGQVFDVGLDNVGAGLDQGFLFAGRSSTIPSIAPRAPPPISMPIRSALLPITRKNASAEAMDTALKSPEALLPIRTPLLLIFMYFGMGRSRAGTPV